MPRRKRVAVVTDATSPDYFFPYWHAYYAEQFGPGSLYVLTYLNSMPAFASFRLGRVIPFDTHYANGTRVQAIAEIVKVLLQRYDAVVRCDVDEFLVAHPLRHPSLADYVDRLEEPYVTAIGLDVLEYVDDPPLRLDGSALLAQRTHCVGAMALNKTAIVQRPLRWSIGFHAADVPPRFDDLFLMHFKFADEKRRNAWFDHMLSVVEPGSFEDGIYRKNKTTFLSTINRLRSLPRREGWPAFEGATFQERFLSLTRRDADDGFYASPFEFEPLARAIPDPVRSIGLSAHPLEGG